jgi:hypothetical protein
VIPLSRLRIARRRELLENSGCASIGPAEVDEAWSRRIGAEHVARLAARKAATVAAAAAGSTRSSSRPATDARRGNPRAANDAAPSRCRRLAGMARVLTACRLCGDDGRAGRRSSFRGSVPSVEQPCALVRGTASRWTRRVPRIQGGRVLRRNRRIVEQRRRLRSKPYRTISRRRRRPPGAHGRNSVTLTRPEETTMPSHPDRVNRTSDKIEPTSTPCCERSPAATSTS